MLLVGHENYPEGFPLPLGVWGEKDGEWDMRGLHHPLGVWGEKDGEWIRGLPSSSWSQSLHTVTVDHSLSGVTA